jgi:methyl-accepting chemotaxis protein
MRLKNASITQKSLLSAMIAAVVLIGMAVASSVSLLMIRHASAEWQAAVALQGGVRTAANDLSLGEAALYRAINLKSQNVEVTIVRAARDEFDRAVKRQQQALAGVASAGVPIDPALVTAAIQAFRAYAESAGQAAQFVEEDAFNATMFMTDAEQKYDAAQKAAANLVARGDALAGSTQLRMQTVLQMALVVLPACALLAVLLSVGATAWIGRLTARPIVAMTQAMRQLAGGDLTVELAETDRRDEVGMMAEALLVFRTNAQEAHRLQEEADKAHAAKERRQAAMDRYTNDFGTSAGGVMTSLLRSAETMRASATEMSDAAHRTRADALRTADGASESAQNLGAVAAAAEQMSASIAEIGQQVGRATQAVHEAVERSAQTDSKVSDMAAAADRVGHVVELINAIAGQTNLLALNATIEAARAGEAGKGFAVVAGEVKALAAQTARATDEISTHIAAIRTATGEAVEAVRGVGETIGQVDQVASAIAAAVEEQATVTRNIVASVQTVAAATQEATSAMQDVARLAETSDAASSTVLQSADDVAQNAATLRSEVDQFLAAMNNTSEDERRLYERVPGRGATALLKVRGRPDQHLVVRNISRGGVALVSDWVAEPGSALDMVLTGSDGLAAGRVVRADNGLLAIAFRQDPATRTAVDATLRWVEDQRIRAEAAAA